MPPERIAPVDPSRASARPGGAPDHAAEIGEVMVDAERLRLRVAELAREISRDYAGTDRPLLLVGVLKGAMFFLSDLMRLIEIPVEVDFMAVASYGSATDSSGVVRILKDLDAAIDDRDVLIVEDIVDSGLTLQYLLRNLGSRDPRTLEVCALLMKPDRSKIGRSRGTRAFGAGRFGDASGASVPPIGPRFGQRTADLPPRYVGFEIPDRFVIGYGLDYAERHRNLPFVAALEVS
jgi:hypoxanthine phosphoribosyltransferase